MGLLSIMGLAFAGCSSQSESADVTPTPTPAVTATPTVTPIGPKTGKLAPDFILPSISGEEVKLSDFRGKPVLVNFWATWCPPCRAELPYLISAHNDYADQGLVILAVDIGENLSTVKDFVEQREIPLTVLLDSKNKTARAYHIGAIPTSFLIDRQGIIQEVRLGAFPDSESVAKSLHKIL